MGVDSSANDGFRDHVHVWDALGTALPNIEDRIEVLKELAADSPAGKNRRKQLQSAIELTEHEFHALGIEMNQLYESTAIQEDHAANESPERHNPDPVLYHFPSTRPGRRLPHVWLNSAIPTNLISTHDLAGKGNFVLFTGIGGSAWKDAAIAVSRSMRIPIKAYSIGYDQDYEDAYFDWARVRGVDESGCVLVRPDRFVTWRIYEMKADKNWAKELLGNVIASVLSR
jgi:hypothetical protein